MMKRIAITLLAVLIWSAFIGFGFVEGFLLRPINSKDTTAGFLAAAKAQIDQEYVGNLAMTLIEEGEVVEEWFYSEGAPVDRHTLFPVASISKWVTSFGVLKLVEEGKFDLDLPIDHYLSRWHLPESNFDNREVTARRLLAHTAGLVDDLGYAGFTSEEEVQTLEASLTRAADAHYSEGVAKVGYEPGSQYRYSGAGYTILQLVIEEITGQSFHDYMTAEVLKPLGMQQSTFVPSEKIHSVFAEVYKADGTIRSMNTFTALAAASLFTSTADLSCFMLANVLENSVLSEESISEMIEPEAYINQVGIHGLGPHLFSQQKKDSKIIGHDGSGNNAINTAARIDVFSKSGIIILETGHPDLASSLADEWMFWKAGVADYVVMQRNLPYLLKLLGVGAVFIVLVGVFWRR